MSDGSGGAPDAGAADAASPDAFSLPPASCTWVESGIAPAGQTQLTVQTLVSGLEIPWALAFPAAGDILVTEMPGRLRLVRGGTLYLTTSNCDDHGACAGNKDRILKVR